MANEIKPQVNSVRVHHHGGPEVLKFEAILLEPPKPDEIRVRNMAIGVNFVDIYFRKGVYAPPTLPFTPGNEGAGVVIASGSDMTGFTPGDRVAYVQTLGSYSEECNVPARYAVQLPIAIDFDSAAAIMLKGLTAQYLLRRTFRVQAGHTILVHAAAGGVGSLLAQWAKHIGATVIGTVGSEEKVEIARKFGCDFVIQRGREDCVQRVREITDGAMCDVVYDGIGKTGFPTSIDCLRRFGYWVNYGAASGEVESFNIGLLMTKGSIFATSQLLFDHLVNREDVNSMSKELFDMLETRAISSPLQSRIALSDVMEAHRRLEGKATTGAMILIP